jgi:hypothetical protein
MFATNREARLLAKLKKRAAEDGFDYLSVTFGDGVNDDPKSDE